MGRWRPKTEQKGEGILESRMSFTFVISYLLLKASPSVRFCFILAVCFFSHAFSLLMCDPSVLVYLSLYPPPTSLFVGLSVSLLLSGLFWGFFCCFLGGGFSFTCPFVACISIFLHFSFVNNDHLFFYNLAASVSCVWILLQKHNSSFFLLPKSVH